MITTHTLNFFIMEDITYTFKAIEPIAAYKGAWIELRICAVFTNDKYPDYRDLNEVEIMTFAKCFNAESDVERFKKTKLYKQIFKACVTNWNDHHKFSNKY